MEAYAVTPIFGLILLLAMIGGARWLLMLTAAMIPFGMMAVITLPSVGGLSLLAVNLSAAALVGWGCLALTGWVMAARPIRIEPATIALLCFAGYAVFSATVLVRLFAGESMVFALARGATGVRVSTFFAWGKVWLGPSNANISQTFYVLLACGFFVAAVHVLTRHGAGFGARCMALAAWLNLVLGIMDLAALDTLLSFIRTANYSLLNEATVKGIPRIVGGFSEPSGFASASAMFFGFFASAFLHSRRRGDAVLALGSGAMTVLALSSTGFIALAVVGVALAPRLLRLRARLRRPEIIVIAVIGGILTSVIAALLLFTSAPDMVASVIDNLIFSKTESSSGMERTAWAMGGLEALRDTWGLGAGTGSLRSNGMIFVLLGSVGIIGTGAFLAFLFLAFGGRARGANAAQLSNARIGGLAVLSTMLLSATVPDPGAPLMLLAAIAVASRRREPVRAPEAASGAGDYAGHIAGEI